MIYQTVAEAVTIEIDPVSGEVKLIFRVTDADFKKEILKDFSKDMELYIKKKEQVNERK